MKATFIKNVYNKYDKNSYEKLYEYKGHEYFVTVYITGYPLGESLREQHKYNQARIDRSIKEFNQPKTQYTGETEKALNAYINWLNDEIMDEEFEKMFK